MEVNFVPPVLDTKEVLLSHLCAILKQSNMVCDEQFDEVVEKLFKLDKMDLFSLISDQKLLQLQINEMAHTSSKSKEYTDEQFGNDLFDKVSRIDNELAGHITGMILELKREDVIHLLQNEHDLYKAISKARTEYLKTFYSDNELTAEELAENVYHVVQSRYPHNGAKITGMLLELPKYEVLHLLDYPSLFNKKADVACAALKQSGVWVTE